MSGTTRALQITSLLVKFPTLNLSCDKQEPNTLPLPSKLHLLKLIFDDNLGKHLFQYLVLKRVQRQMNS